MLSGLLLVQGWSDHLVAAGFILLLLSAQFLQFKLIWRPRAIKIDAIPAGCAPREIEMPEDLRRFFVPAPDGKVRVAA